MATLSTAAKNAAIDAVNQSGIPSAGVRFVGFDDSQECRGSYYRSIKPSFRCGVRRFCVRQQHYGGHKHDRWNSYAVQGGEPEMANRMEWQRQRIDVDYSGLRHRRHGDSDKLDAEHFKWLILTFSAQKRPEGFRSPALMSGSLISFRLAVYLRS